MKYTLIIALLILTIAARSVHKVQEDPLKRCISKKCRSEAVACAKTQGCSNNLQSCTNSLQSSGDLSKFDECLQKVPTSFALMECIFNQCADVERESIVFEEILKRLN